MLCGLVLSPSQVSVKVTSLILKFIERFKC